MKNLLPNFEFVPLTTQEVVVAARDFRGLRYSETGTWVEFGTGGQPVGATNCFGLIFLVVARLGLVPPTIFQSLSLAAVHEPLPFVLMRYLDRNCIEIEKATRQPGDITLFRWNDPDAAHREMGESSLDRQHHHVAILSDLAPAPCGSLVHAIDTDANKKGGVFETVLNAHDAAQIQRVYRLPNLVD